MIVDPKYIREQLIKTWPRTDCRRVTLWRQGYWLISEEEIGWLIGKSDIKNMEFVPGFNDVDNFSLQFQAEVRHKRYLDWEKGHLTEEQQHPIAMAIVRGNLWQGINKGYVANLFVCLEGVFLADIMEGTYWKADTNNDRMLDIDFR